MGIINAVTGIFKNEAPKPEAPKVESPFEIWKRQRDDYKRLRDLREPKSYLELKQFLKDQAEKIRALRKPTVKKPESVTQEEWDLNQQFGGMSLSSECRIYHIAYSMLRGKTMEQIEQKTRNPLKDADLKKIEEIKATCARPPRIVQE